MSERNLSSGTHAAWDEADERFRRLTPSEAAALRAKNPQLSPWRVIVAQAAVGGVVALLAWLLGGGREHAWSALYGAVTAVVPGALLARGMTSRLSSVSPVVSAFSVMTHFEAIQKGVLDSRDILYFISVIVFCLFTTSVILRAHRAG
jgi:ATP synthase protein I